MATGHLFRWCCQPRWFVFPASSLMHSTTRLCTMASKQLTCPLFISLLVIDAITRNGVVIEVGYVGEFARGVRHKCLRLAAC
jgi:hypothetical protein